MLLAKLGQADNGETVMPLSLEVTLLAKAAELAGAHQVSVDIEGTTPRDVLLALAQSNALLHDQILRGDGTPRSSTRILVNGFPPSSLDEEISTGANVSVVVMFPCDG